MGIKYEPYYWYPKNHVKMGIYEFYEIYNGLTFQKIRCKHDSSSYIFEECYILFDLPNISIEYHYVKGNEPQYYKVFDLIKELGYEMDSALYEHYKGTKFKSWFSDLHFRIGHFHHYQIIKRELYEILKKDCELEKKAEKLEKDWKFRKHGKLQYNSILAKYSICDIIYRDIRELCLNKLWDFKNHVNWKKPKNFQLLEYIIKQNKQLLREKKNENNNSRQRQQA